MILHQNVVNKLQSALRQNWRHYESDQS
jgi:hypothetical protein